MMPSITLLCSDGPHHLYLAAELQKAFGRVRLIVEPSHCQASRIWKIGNYRSYLWIKYHEARRYIFGYSKYRKSYFKRNDGIKDWNTLLAMEGVKYLETPWINDLCVINELRKEASDVYIVMGTKIISPEVLSEIPPDRIINLHGGHLPDYKGNHCFFFALNSGDYKKLSTTVHRISSGLDSGEIISQHSVNFNNKDNSEKLYSRAEKIAINQLVNKLKIMPDIASWESFPQENKGKVYRMRDRGPTVEIKHFFRMRRIKKKAIKKDKEERVAR